MFYNCVLSPKSYKELKEKYGDNACEHCIYHRYNCPNRETIIVNGSKFIPIENKKILPKYKVCCEDCGILSGIIKHIVLWRGKNAYAIKCHVCGTEYLLYPEIVEAEYKNATGRVGKCISLEK